MEREMKNNIVALIYGIDKGVSIKKTEENFALLFDYVQQELDKAREEGIKEGAKEMFEELELFPIPKDYLKVFLSNLKNNK
jgi:hypothetical protein